LILANVVKKNFELRKTYLQTTMVNGYNYSLNTYRTINKPNGREWKLTNSQI